MLMIGSYRIFIIGVYWGGSSKYKGLLRKVI